MNLVEYRDITEPKHIGNKGNIVSYAKFIILGKSDMMISVPIWNENIKEIQLLEKGQQVLLDYFKKPVVENGKLFINNVYINHIAELEKVNLFKKIVG